MALSEKDYESILNFSCEIGENYSGFYENVLKMISKHFNYNNLAFFPENINTSSINDINRVLYTNCYSINLENNFLKEFNEYYHRVSIFQPLNLPEKLLNKKLIKINDIMPYNDFKKTEQFHYLNRYKISYALNANLYSGDIKLGTICIFKSKEEGDFTDKELALIEQIRKVLSLNYNNFLKLSNSIFEQNLLKKCYDNYSEGIIIWNNKLSILVSNMKAQQFCLEVVASVSNLNTDHHNNVISKTNNPIKKTINFLSYNLIEDYSNPNLNILSNDYLYDFKTTAIITSTITGTMETIYFTTIKKQRNIKTVPLDKTKDFYNLTERELEIINLIKKGSSNKEISAVLFLSSNTVKTHITNIFKKLGVNSRTALLSKIIFS